MQSNLNINPNDLGPNAREWLAKTSRLTGIPASILITSALLDFRARAESSNDNTANDHDQTASRTAR